MTNFDFWSTQGWLRAFWSFWPEKALWVLQCLNRLYHVSLDVFAVPQWKMNIFRFLGVQHANRGLTKYGIYREKKILTFPTSLRLYWQPNKTLKKKKKTLNLPIFNFDRHKNQPNTILNQKPFETPNQNTNPLVIGSSSLSLSLSLSLSIVTEKVELEITPPPPLTVALPIDLLSLMSDLLSLLSHRLYLSLSLSLYPWPKTQISSGLVVWLVQI